MTAGIRAESRPSRATRLARGHGGGQAARCHRDGRGPRPPRQARDRECHSRTRIPAGVLGATAGRTSRRRAQPGSAALGVHLDQGSRVPGVMYVEELIGPETVDTMPEETIRRSGPWRSGRHPDQENRRGRAVVRGAARRPASTTTTLWRQWRRRASRSSPTRSPSCSMGSTPSAASSSPHERRAGARRTDLGARHLRLDRLGRGSVARLAGRAFSGSSTCPPRLSAIRALRPARNGRLEPGAGSLPARASSRAISTSSTRRIQKRSAASRSRSTSGVRSSSPRRSRGRRSRRAPISSTSGSAPGQNPEQFAVVTDPGSELETLAQERGFHAIFHGEPSIGGRYSALSASGWSRPR